MMKILRLLTVLTLSFVTTANADVVHADTVTQFQAELSSGAVIKGGVVGSTAAGSGLVDFVLTIPDGNPAGTTLAYNMQVFNADLDGLQTPGVGNELDNVTAIHIHNTTMCGPNPACQLGDTALTAHVLNILGPAHELDYVVDPVNSQADGVWDDGDEVAGMPPTKKISDPAIQALLAGENLFYMVHTVEFPAGAFGGFITQVPEPSTLLLACGFCTLLAMRRRKSC